MLCVFYCRILYNLEFGREMDSVRGHEDAVSCLTWGSKNQVLVSGSWDCSVRVWQGMADGRRIKPSSSLTAQFDHDAHITCLSLTRWWSWIQHYFEDVPNFFLFFKFSLLCCIIKWLICDLKSEPTAGVIYGCKNKNWFMMSMASLKIKLRVIQKVGKRIKVMYDL